MIEEATVLERCKGACIRYPAGNRFLASLARSGREMFRVVCGNREYVVDKGSFLLRLVDSRIALPFPSKLQTSVGLMMRGKCILFRISLLSCDVLRASRVLSPSRC